MRHWVRFIIGAIAVIVLGALVGLGAGTVVNTVVAFATTPTTQQHQNDQNQTDAIQLRRQLDDVRRALAEARWYVFDRRDQGAHPKEMHNLLVKIDHIDSQLLDLEIEQLRKAGGRIQ